MLGGSYTATTYPTPAPSDVPASPTRPGRLRRLSYLLRNPEAPISRSVNSPAGADLAEALAPSTPSPEPGIARILRHPDQIASSHLRPNSPIDIPVANMTRNRSDAHFSSPSARPAASSHPGVSRSISEDVTNNHKQSQNMPTIRLIPHQEARAARPSLTFPIINRTLQSHDSVIRVGRYSERDNQAAQQDSETSSLVPVGFKSKVVSRRHCEFWCQNNQWYVKDVRSSSGTFLNHVRLSSAGSESKPYPLNDGDIVQLGIDFKGGEEVIFRCVKIRVECNRSWQKGLNHFNTTAHKRLRDLASASKDPETASLKSDECSICLNPVAPYQALFVAPCSHVWHYKCIRTLIYPEWPSFQCPNCRAYADLEADVDVQEAEFNAADDDSDAELSEAIRRSNLEHSATNHTLTDTASHDRNAASSGGGGDDEQAHDGPPPRPGATRSSSEVGPGTSFKDRSGFRSATPTSTAPFALVARVIDGSSSSSSLSGSSNVRLANEGPTTPRNDAGPFLLDSIGGGGATGGSRAVQSVSGPSSGPMGEKRSVPRRAVTDGSRN